MEKALLLTSDELEVAPLSWNSMVQMKAKVKANPNHAEFILKLE